MGNNGSLASIAAPVTVQHSNTSWQTTVDVDDSAETGRAVQVSSNSVSFTNVPLISFGAISSLQIVGSGGYNNINVSSPPSGPSLSLYNMQHNYLTGSAAWSAAKQMSLANWDALWATDPGPGLACKSLRQRTGPLPSWPPSA